MGSLARPGGNVTGFSILAQDLAAKRVELLTTPVCGGEVHDRLGVMVQQTIIAEAERLETMVDAGGKGAVMVRPARGMGERRRTWALSWRLMPVSMATTQLEWSSASMACGGLSVTTGPVGGVPSLKR